MFFSEVYHRHWIPLKNLPFVLSFVEALFGFFSRIGIAGGENDLGAARGLSNKAKSRTQIATVRCAQSSTRVVLDAKGYNM